MYDHSERLSSAYPSMPRTYLLFIADDAGGTYVVVCRKASKSQNSEFGSVLYLPGHQSFDAEFKNGDFIRFILTQLEFWKAEI